VGIATVSRGAKAMQSHDVSALLATHRQGSWGTQALCLHFSSF
jgi:hypothetical protein